MNARACFSILGVAVLAPLSTACHDDDADMVEADGGAYGPPVCAPEPAPVKPAAACDVSVIAPPIQELASRHAPEGTTLTYCSNPPSSGTHYPVWADYLVYAREIPAPYLVHSLEHGAVALLYNCPEGCPDVVVGLEAIRAAQPDDPLCAPFGSMTRILVAPSAAIPTRIAATAWGAIYRADCLDPMTLSAFVTEHYGKGPEAICSPGRPF